MPTSRDVAEIGLKLIAVYFVMQGLAVIAPIAATLGAMPSIPPARWFVSLAHPAALIVSGLAIYAGSRLGARAIAGKLGTPPAATAGATEFVRGALVAVGAYVMIMALVSIFSASLRSLVHSSHTLTWELMTLGPQLALGICLVLGTVFIRSRGPLKNS